MRVISRWLAFNTAEKHFAHQSLSHTVVDMHTLRLKGYPQILPWQKQALWRLPDAPSPSFHAFSRHAKTLRVWSWHTRATFLQNPHRWVQEMTGYGLKWVFRSSPSPVHHLTTASVVWKWSGGLYIEGILSPCASSPASGWDTLVTTTIVTG